MTLNDLECPIHLKVRFTDGTLDVRTLWLSEIRPYATGIDRGGGGRRGSGMEGLGPLHRRGQLTRCFSAVAELLVSITNRNFTAKFFLEQGLISYRYS